MHEADVMQEARLHIHLDNIQTCRHKWNLLGSAVTT